MKLQKQITNEELLELTRKAFENDEVAEFLCGEKGYSVMGNRVRPFLLRRYIRISTRLRCERRYWNIIRGILKPPSNSQSPPLIPPRGEELTDRRQEKESPF